MTERVAFPNLHVDDDGAPFFNDRAPLDEDQRAFVHLVDEPPDAWPWLASTRVVVAWASTHQALEFARDEVKPLWNTVPSVAGRVSNRSFCAVIARQHALDPGVSEHVMGLDVGRVSTEGIENVVEAWPPEVRAQFEVVPLGGVELVVPGREGVFRFDNVEGLTPFVRRGGALVRPAIERRLRFTSCWFIDGHGEPHALGCVRDDGAGAFHVERGAFGPCAGTEHDEVVVEKARVIVEAAAKLEYRGVCAVDAFTWKDTAGDVQVRGAAAFHAGFTRALLAIAAHLPG